MSNAVTAARRSTKLVAALVATAALAAGSAYPAGAHAATPAPSHGATTQGIIMRDGGVCDPMRHMGC